MYATSAGIAAAMPATVVINASAMPGATAAMLPAPFCPMPKKASMTPRTVPKRPNRGLTLPTVASDGINLAAASRSAPTSLPRTIFRASSWVTVRLTRSTDPSLKTPGARSP